MSCAFTRHTVFVSQVYHGNVIYKDRCNYWLFCWRDAYEYALDNAPAGAIFIGYEQLCADPLSGFTRLLPQLSLDAEPDACARFYSAAEERLPADSYDNALYDSCLATHGRLIQRHLV